MTGAGENPVTAKISILFRTDAGIHVGIGHLQRCLSLATALAEYGAVCSFLTNGGIRVRERVEGLGFACFQLPSIESWGQQDLDQTEQLARQLGCAAIIVDSDHEGITFLAALRAAGNLVCAIEDNSLHPYPCQLVVNGDAHAGQLRYESCSSDTMFLLGPQYSILRREFWEVPWYAARDPVRCVLVTLGGTDPLNLTAKAIGALDSIPADFSVTVIAGPFFTHHREIKAAAAHAARPVRVIDSPRWVRDIMLSADLAVSAAGQTLYELACLGRPTVAIRTAGNQDGQLRAFAEEGVVRPAGFAEDAGVVTQIADAVATLLCAPDARTKMSEAGRRLVDGRGAERVARAVLSALLGTPSPRRTA